MNRRPARNPPVKWKPRIRYTHVDALGIHIEGEVRRADGSIIWMGTAGPSKGGALSQWCKKYFNWIAPAELCGGFEWP